MRFILTQQTIHSLCPKLSVCLIVKNEEPVLRRCLECAVRFADELVVVDTGSADRSVEIAREFTDKVFIHPWRNSFAEARNFSYSQATGEWLMWLDADDFIDDENIRRFQRLKDGLTDADDVVFTIYGRHSETGLSDYIMRDRIIRRALNPQWFGDVHEGIPIRPEWRCRHAVDIRIQHWKLHVNEPKRNIDIYDGSIERGASFTVFEKANLCKELALHGRDERAVEVFREMKSDAALAAYVHYYAFVFVRASLARLGRHGECLAEIEELNGRLETAYMAYWQGACLEMLSRFDEAESCYRRAMEIPEDPTTLAIQFTGYTDYYPLLRLAALAARRGDMELAIALVERAGRAYPRDMSWRLLRLGLLSRAEGLKGLV